MPNLTQMSRLLRALRQEAKAAKPAGDLEEIMARLPKAPPEVEARVLAEIEARDRARREMYKVPEVDKTKGKKALAEARRILMTPEERAAYEAQLREQGLQSFLEPSAVKQRMYHGTVSDFNEFLPDSHFGTATAANQRARSWSAQNGERPMQVMPVYLQIKNPLRVLDNEASDEAALLNAIKRGKYPELDLDIANKEGAHAAAKAAGYDGLVYKNKVEDRNKLSYVAFDPTQIKSAIGNRGTYDITDPDITKAEGGLAQYGLRHSGEGVKGKGYFGLLPNKMDGVSTEISVEDETGEYPLIVPTLTAEELDRLLAGGEPTPEMLDKASSWAATRRKRGESPFASPTEVRMPRPKAEGGLAMQAGGVPTFMKLIKKLTIDIKKAEKAGDLATSLEKRKELNNAIQFGVNDPLMPRAQPLTQAEIRMYAERMAPQVAGELTRGVDAKTVAGKSQKQFKREQTLPIDRKVLPGAVDPSAPLPYMTLEDQKGSVLLGLPGDPTLARVSVSGIGDVPFEQAVTQHGGPRYGDDEKLWASNLSAATGLLNAADRASRQFGDAPVIASYMKMPTGFGFAQHYLETLLQYQRPDLLNKAAREALEKDIKEGFVKQGKRVAFPNFPGFDDLGAVAQAAENDSNLRKHIAAKLSTSEKYGLRPAADVQFAVSHPELTNLETGASGFTLGELIPGRLTESAHPTYSHDIPGKVLGQMQYSTPYDLLYRDQLELIRKNPEAPEFNTLKMLGARQKIDEQLVNEINEYQERMRQLLGRKKGGAVKKAEGGSLTDLPDEVNPSNWREHLQNNVRADARALLGVKDGGAISLDDLIEQALKKKDGGAINLDDLIDWTLAKAEHRKMKEGGAVKMQGGGNPGEVAGDMFKPKPLSIPEPITSLVEALRRQFEKEKRSMSKPGAVQDVLMRGPVAAYAGAPADILGMGGELLDYAQKKIPALRKPASVMDTGPEKVPPMGYAPAFPLSPEGSYGTTAAQEMMGKAGLTTGEERPLFETGAMVGAPVAGYAGLKAGKALAPTAKEMMDVQLQRMMSPYQMNVIKPEGGNWIKGAAQKYVEPLKRKEAGGRFSEDVLKELEERYTPEALATLDPQTRAFVEQTAFPVAQANAAINRFVDKKLSKYVQNEMGTSSDPIRIQADAWAKKQQTLLADKQKQIDKVRADIEKARQERNVDPEVLTRSQARLRELQKEKDLIKNRRGLHFNIVDAEIRGEAARVMRAEQGLPEVNTAQSPVGKLWEDTSDYTIRRSPYFKQVPFDAFEEMASVPRPERQAKMAEINKAELEKLGGEFAVQNPSELAYNLNRGMPARMLGFEHLTDELVNALHFNDLPEYLRLTPKTLDKMSVAQVVEHVDKINAWRASQKAEVDKARAANAATVVHKEYPEQGLKWVELKMPDFNSLPLEERKAMIERLREEAKQQGLSPESYIQKYPERMLEDALKYEGEILQHCVGGYCPDVVEGRSRIFSLRDADGRPHATIEVEPVGYEDVFRNLPFDQKREINAVVEKWASNIDYTPNSEEVLAKAEQVMAQLGYKPTEQISQIKGLQNKKPEAEFIPYIQDFVKSGDWSAVGDIGHTDLTPVEALRAAGWDVNKVNQKYLTKEEIKALKSQSGMKRGGRITKADLEREYRMAFGGGVFNTDPDITDAGRIIPEHTI